MGIRHHKRFLLSLAAVLLLVQPLGGVADIYKYTDAEGRIYFTDSPMKGRQYHLLHHFSDQKKTTAPAAKSSSRINLAAAKANRKRFTPLIHTVAEKTRLHPELLHAVVQAESAYDPNAVSRKGAVGLMQLMPATAKRYGVNDRRDPQQNLLAGANYLRDLLVQFDYNMRLAIAAYNAGENAVIRSGNRIPDYPETQNYVLKVMRFYKQNRSKRS
ncbi:MAG: transglycosylase SLT domain-containing protein [Chromatiales bacterium]|jgi:soluble lytic murein transglycosylase-like protein